MNCAFRSFLDGGTALWRSPRTAFWLRLAGAALLMGLVYAYGVHLRLLEWPAWQSSGYNLRGEWLLPTNDAYFELVAADGGRTLEPSGPLARLLALLHAATSLPLGNLGLWAPAWLAPLAALPSMVLLLCWGLPASALLSGVLTASCLGYIARTRMGFYDTDMVNVFFALSLACLVAAWTRATLQAPLDATSQAPLDATSQAPLDATCKASNDMGIASSRATLFRRDAPFVLAGAGIGLVAWCWSVVYPSGLSVAFAVMGACVPVLIWNQRQRLLPALMGVGLMLGFALRPAWGLAALPAILLFLRCLCFRTLSGRLVWILALLICLAVGGTGLWLMWSKVMWHLMSYGLVDTPFGETVVTAGIHTPNSYAMVSEVQRPTIEQLWMFFFSADWMLAVALGMALLALCLYPSLLPLLPLAVLSLGTPWLGARFGVYGPALGALAGAALGGLERGIPWARCAEAACGTEGNTLCWPRWRRFVATGRRVLVWTLALGGSFWLAGTTEMSAYTSMHPARILSPDMVRLLQPLDAKLPHGAVLWCWWDHGFNLQYHVKRHTIADSHFNSFDYIYLPGFVMSTDDPLQASRLMRYSAGHMHPQLNAQTPQHVAYGNTTMATLHAMGHEKATAFLDNLRREEVTSPPGAPEQFMVVSWEGLVHLYHMSAVGKWNLRTGGSPKYYLLPFEGVSSIKVNGNKVTFGSYPEQELDGYAVLDYGGNVEHVKLGAGNNLYAIWNRRTSSGYLLHKDMYNSTYVRLLMWDKKGPPVPGFRLTHDAAPVVRVFQSVAE